MKWDYKITEIDEDGWVQGWLYIVPDKPIEYITFNFTPVRSNVKIEDVIHTETTPSNRNT